MLPNLIRRLPVFAFAALLLSAPSRAHASDPAFTLTPLAGAVGNDMGVGADVTVAYEALSVGMRYAHSEEMCIMCPDAAGEKQTSFLIGGRVPFAIGSFTARTGVASVDRVRKDNFVSNGSFFSDPKYDLHVFQGMGVPVQLDLQLGGRFIGLDLSMGMVFDEDGGAGNFMIGMPVGYLHP